MMGKKFGTAIVLALLLLLTACGSSPQSGQEKPLEGLQDSGPQETVVYSAEKIEGAPSYTEIIGVIDGGRSLIGLSGTKVIKFDLETKEKTNIIDNAWNAFLSPDQSMIAFYNGDGVRIVKLDGKEVVSLGRVWQSEGQDYGTAGEIIWSPDSSKILINYHYEWFTDMYIADVETGKVERLDLGENGKFLTFAVGWVADDQIILQQHANRPADGGEPEYREAGYRSDLAIVKPDGSGFSLLTHSEDDQFIRAPRFSIDGKKAVVTVTKGEFEEANLGIVVLRDSKIAAMASDRGFNLITSDGSSVNGAFAPDGETIVYVKINSFDEQRFAIMLRTPEGEDQTAGEFAQAMFPYSFCWSAQGDAAYFTVYTDKGEQEVWRIKRAG